MYVNFISMKILVLGHSFFINHLPIDKEIINVGFYDYHKIKLKKAVYKIEYILSLLPWKPDLIFLGDDSFPITYIGLEKIEIPTVIYAVDSHIHPWHLYYAHIFDIALFAQKFFIEVDFNFNYHTIKKWFPLYCNPQVHKKLNLKKKYDICFVGTLNPKLNKPRIKLIEALKKRVKNFYIGQGDFVPIFNQSKIVINQLANNDINFRFFEALSCGSFLLSERVVGNGFIEIFKEGRDLVCFEKGNVDEAVEKINYYLKNHDEAEKIALNGFNLVRKEHTVTNRAKQFLNILNKCKLENLLEKRFKNIKEVNFFLKMAYITASDLYSYDKKLSELYSSLAEKL